MLFLCVGMYRACSTWQYGVAGLLLERYRDGARLGYIDGCRFENEVLPGLDLTKFQVLKAHDAHPVFSRLLAEGNAVALYSHRDLRDVAFSWMHKIGATFDEIVERGFFGLCVANDRFWRKQSGVLCQTYEQLIADPVQGVVQIAAHLGIEISLEDAREIANTLSLESSRKRTSDLAERLKAIDGGINWFDQDRYDRETLLHWNHIRDGRAGDWKKQATPEQRRVLAQVCGHWLIEHGYETDLSWADNPWPAIPKLSFAENGEDILLDRMFHDRQGTYIDVGANDPTRNNNTHYFYLRGWRGVNIEPVRAAFKRFDDLRPDDLNLEIAISDVEGMLPFFEVANRIGLSSTSLATAEMQRSLGLRVVERSVPTWTIASLVDEYHLAPPEVFSIDVSGEEGRVLRGIPLDRWQPKVFVIDATPSKDNNLGHLAWETTLLNHGYLFAKFDGINRYYLRRDQAEFLPLFDRPVTSLDGYERAEIMIERSRAEALESERSRTHDLLVQTTATLGSLTSAFDEIRTERDSWQRERDAWQQERDAWQRERDSVTRERDAWQRERDNSQRERDASTMKVDSQAESIRQLQYEIVRLEQERQTRTVEVQEVQSQLRPYRMIDRFGVVTALHRRVRATKAKLRSRSW